MNNSTTNSTASNNNAVPMPFVIQRRGVHDNDDDSEYKSSNMHSTTSSHTNVDNVAIGMSPLPSQKNMTKHDENNNNKQDFIITFDLQDDKNKPDNNNNEKNNDLWLIISDQYHTVTQNEHGTVRRRKGLAIIASSSNKRDEYIQSNIHNLPNGYTLKNISTLEQLRNDLNNVYFPSSQSRLQLHDDYSNDNNSAIMYPLASEINKVNHKELNEVKRYELFRQIIQYEDNSLNQRISWIILAQSFLMAAFITSTGPKTLRYVTALVGLATTIVAMPSIIAAGRNIEIQQQTYFNMLESDDRCYTLHGHRRDYRKLEVEEAMRRKHYGHLLPTMAFRGKGSLSILTTVILLGVVQFIGWCLLLVSFAAS